MKLDTTTIADVNAPLVSICGPEGYTPEQWALMAVKQIISISDSAPPPLRDQAYAFSDAMLRVIAATIRDAVTQGCNLQVP